MVQRQHGKDRLRPAGATQQVAGHGLGGVHHQPVGMVAESSLDGLGFVDVAQRRGCAVGVQVMDLVGVDARRCAAQSSMARRGPSDAGGGDVARRQRSCQSRPVRRRCGRHAALACSYSSSTSTPAAFTQHESVAVLVPGAAGGGGIVVAGATLHAPRQNPPMPSGETVASAPPATMTSASPYSIRRPASPMQCRPVVQADTTAIVGPLEASA